MTDARPLSLSERLLAECPHEDPRVRVRRDGWAVFDLGEHRLVLAAHVRAFAGWAKPEGDAAAVTGALAGWSALSATPLAVVQSHRIGEAEAPGLEGRLKALRASALQLPNLAQGGTVHVASAHDALVHTGAFALGWLPSDLDLSDLEAADVLDAEALDPLPDGEAPPFLPKGAPTARGIEAQVRWALSQPHLANATPLCGAATSGRATLVPLPHSRSALALACADAASSATSDPYWAAAGAVVEAALRVACTGAEPVAVAVAVPLGRAQAQGAWALSQGVAGLRQAALALELPVVALATCPLPAEAVEASTIAPMVAVMGSMEDHSGPIDLAAAEASALTMPGQRSCGATWRAPFEALYVLGEASEEVYLDEALRLVQTLREGITLGLLRSAREVSRGGVLGAIVNGGIASGMGAQILLPPSEDTALFAEGLGRVVVSLSVEGESALRTLCGTHRVPFAKVGVTGGTRFSLALGGHPVFDAEVQELASLQAQAWGPWLG